MHLFIFIMALSAIIDTHSIARSAFAPVHSSVPHGSVHGPILFTMHIKPLSAIIDSLYYTPFVC